jgi:hypothetical protein
MISPSPAVSAASCSIVLAITCPASMTCGLGRQMKSPE